MAGIIVVCSSGRYWIERGVNERLVAGNRKDNVRLRCRRSGPQEQNTKKRGADHALQPLQLALPTCCLPDDRRMSPTKGTEACGLSQITSTGIRRREAVYMQKLPIN